MKGDHNTFGGTARTVFAVAIKEGILLKGLMLFDTYSDISIKCSERRLKKKTMGQSFIALLPTSLSVSGDHFKDSANKTNCIIFFL